MATSKGDIIRENQCVLKTYKERYLELHPEASKAKPPNINCDVHGFGVTAATLLKATVKRNYLSDMGMESLLYFVGKSLDRQLAYYVLSRMNDTDMSIIDNDGRKVFVTAEKINWVLDIPIAKKEEKREKIRLKKLPKSNLYKKFETTRGIKDKTAGVFKETLKNAVLNSDDENEFKEAFLLYAICTVLCPSTYDRVQSKYLPLISLAHDANSYDWCELVFADLKANVGKFKEAFDENGVIKGLGGAVYVLMIIYLDHLDQQPLKWDVSPRISAWTEDDIRDVKKADKHPKGDFGKIGELEAQACENENEVTEINGSSSNVTSSQAKDDPMYLKLWDKSKRHKNGKFDDEAEEKFKELKELHEKEIGEKGVDNLTLEEAYVKVLGHRSGYARGLGKGHPVSSKDGNIGRAELEQNVEKLQNENNIMRAELEASKKKQEDLEQKLWLIMEKIGLNA